jgi:hypothetical protein
MLSTYFNALRRHGLAIDRVVEPRPPPEWDKQRPELSGVPTFLVVRGQRM